MEQKHIYTLELTERQAKALSYVCDQFPRLIEGQDWSYQELFEAAWEKRCKEATGTIMDKKWNGGWNRMRIEAEILTRQIKERFWGLESGANYGIHYDEYADMIWDIYRVIRHQLWKDNPNRSNITVDSENPTSPIGKEPLAIIKRKEEIDKKPKNPLDLSDRTPEQAEAFISSLGALGYETSHLMREYRQTGKIQL